LNAFSSIASLDGRATPPSSGVYYIGALQKKIEEVGAAKLLRHRRYYAMDRDTRWNEQSVL